MSLSTKQQVVITIIEDIMPQVEALALMPEIRRFVHYVKNQLFPKGVYRVHARDFVPKYLELSSEDYEAVSQHFDNVHFDSSSLWLTIHVKNDNLLS